MLKYHPLASDMRNVIATMKFSVNLERIADQAVNIARRSRKLIARPSVPETAELEPLFLVFRQQDGEGRASQAFADNDLEPWPAALRDSIGTLDDT